MTGEEFTAVLQLIHPKLGWNYGKGTKVAGVVLRDGTEDQVKLMEYGKNAEDTLQRLIERFEKYGVKL